MNEPDASLAARTWSTRLRAYQHSSNVRASLEIALTAVPLVLFWVLMWLSSHVSPWLPFVLTIPTAFLLVRMFMIQHDCGHGAFFSSRRANDWTGRIIGVLTLTPYDFWRQSHAIHHAGSGNLDRRGIGDVDTLTADEYRARGRWGRLRYRIYRHPLVMFGIGPAYLFLLQHRLPVGAMSAGAMPWKSTMLTNLSGLAIVVGLSLLMGFGTFLLIHLPIVILSSSIGVWLFYIQHQFEQTYWERDTEWEHPDAALHGSSYYDLPPALMWLTGYIGVHHVHHLVSRIPFYRLPQVLVDYPELRKIGRISLRDSLGCVKLALWDGAQKKMIPFGSLDQR